MNKELLNTIAIIWIAIAVLLFPLLMRIKAPYGRHTTTKFGLLMDNKLGWILMEVSSLLIFIYLCLTGKSEKSTLFWIVCGIYTLHYINRSFIYPLRTKTKNKKIPVVIVVFALIFNFMNAGLNGYFLGNYFDASSGILFYVGLIICIVGIVINIYSDEILLSLRTNNSSGEYKIPFGFMYSYITCPNYFGEIIEWIGWAMMAWNLPALSFVLWTIANLVPRAKDHHKWYHEKFAEYPQKRKIIIPYIY